MVTFRAFEFFCQVHAPLLNDNGGDESDHVEVRRVWVKETTRLVFRSFFFLMIQNSANINIQSSVAGLAKATNQYHNWEWPLMIAIAVSICSTTINLWMQTSRMKRLVGTWFANVIIKEEDAKSKQLRS